MNSLTPEERLTIAIEDLLLDAIEFKNIKLPPEEYEFIIRSLSSFSIEAIYKYLAGAKEHGGSFLTDRDHLLEVRREIIDALFYIEALKQTQKII